MNRIECLEKMIYKLTKAYRHNRPIGMCAAYIRAKADDPKFLPKDVFSPFKDGFIQEYPKSLIFMPSVNSLGYYWFPPDDIESRLDIIQRLIKMEKGDYNYTIRERLKYALNLIIFKYENYVYKL